RAAGVETPVTRSAVQRALQELGHEALPSERAVVRGEPAARGPEEALEVRALQDVALVPAAVVEVRGDPFLREAPRQEAEGRRADAPRAERHALRAWREVVDWVRHAERTQDRERRALREVPERRRPDADGLHDELERGHASDGRDVGDGERAAQIRAEALAR